MGTIIKNINGDRDKITRRINSENDCYYTVKKLFSFSLNSKTLKIKLYEKIILSCVLCGCEKWSISFREESEQKITRKLSGT